MADFHEDDGGGHQLLSLGLRSGLVVHHVDGRYYVSNNPNLGKLFSIYPSEVGRFTSWSHLRIFTWRALREVLTAHNFRVEVLLGVGYYPLTGRAARFAARVDGRHAAYVTAKAIRI